MTQNLGPLKRYIPMSNLSVEDFWPKTWSIPACIQTDIHLYAYEDNCIYSLLLI